MQPLFGFLVAGVDSKLDRCCAVSKASSDHVADRIDHAVEFASSAGSERPHVGMKSCLIRDLHGRNHMRPGIVDNKWFDNELDARRFVHVKRVGHGRTANRFV